MLRNLNRLKALTNDQYNSWRGCALSVAMPQALRLLYETRGERSVQVTNENDSLRQLALIAPIYLQQYIAWLAINH